MLLVEPVVLAVMGVGFVVAGWQGFRLRFDPDALACLSKTERRRRTVMLRSGSYACVISGATLVLLAVLVTYALVTELGRRSLLHSHTALPALPSTSASSRAPVYGVGNARPNAGLDSSPQRARPS